MMIMENPEILYPEDNAWTNSLFYLISIQSICAMIVLAVILINLFFKTKKLMLIGVVLVCLAILINFTIYAIVPKVSPAPFIDVFIIMTEGADQLLNGINPYKQLYADIYEGQYQYTPRYIYWPVVAYSLTLFRLITGDVRYAYVFSLLLTSIGAMIFIYREVKRPIMWMIVVCWLCFPVGLLVLEQTWVETLLLPAGLGLAVCLYFKRFIGAAIFLGVLCATKQFLLFFALSTFIYIWRHYGWRSFLRVILICSLTTILIDLPFLIMDTDAFLKRTVFEVANYEIRTDSFSWISVFARYLKVFTNWYWAVGVFTVSFLASVIWLYLCRKPLLSQLLGSNVFVYSCVFIFGKQAFCNYYYYLAFLVWLTIFFWMVEGLKAPSSKSLPAPA